MLTSLVHVYSTYLVLMYLLTTRKVAWYIISVVSIRMSICMSVCLLDYNFQNSGHSKFSFPRLVYLQRIRVKIVFEGQGQGQGHRCQKGRKFLRPQCKTSISNNSRYIKQSRDVCVQHGFWCLCAAWGFGCDVSNGVTAIFVTDWKWSHVTTHSWVVLPLSPSSISWYWPKGGDARRLGR